jgi:hypothetical protein
MRVVVAATCVLMALTFLAFKTVNVWLGDMRAYRALDDWLVKSLGALGSDVLHALMAAIVLVYIGSRVARRVRSWFRDPESPAASRLERDSDE